MDILSISNMESISGIGQEDTELTSEYIQRVCKKYEIPKSKSEKIVEYYNNRQFATSNPDPSDYKSELKVFRNKMENDDKTDENDSQKATTTENNRTQPAPATTAKDIKENQLDETIQENENQFIDSNSSQHSSNSENPDDYLEKTGYHMNVLQSEKIL